MVLGLGQVFREVYAEAAYDLSVDYRQAPPPPALSDEDRAWAQALLLQA